MRVNECFDAEIEEYEKWFNENDKLLSNEINIIKQLLPDFNKGIEIGVGTGIFASKLGIKNGVEPSKKMASKAIERGICVEIGKAENLPVADECYNLALMVTVDCYLNDVFKAFLEVNRILVKNGVFVIAFLDKSTPLGKIYEDNKHLDKNYKYATFHSYKEISDWLIKANFEIMDRKQTIYSLDNDYQEIKTGSGEGVFVVIKAKKQ
ncbi:MAG: class I SAM-dependent methyltransferase [Candidatus Muirbacterium halophilum]|nr:class I SAM-dependent methyltransferase [Candidatus Muirbacterium halophilum]MCK9476191.1 class I SAM-dependent methyltransferase [Candidatus Muirbacterium halophilum]